MSSQEVAYQISIIEDRVNPLIERRELRIEVASQTTPQRDLLRKSIAASLKVPVERVYVKNVISSYGKSMAVCKVNVYDNEERAKMIEPKYVQLRNLSREDRKAALTPAPKQE